MHVDIRLPWPEEKNLFLLKNPTWVMPLEGELTIFINNIKLLHVSRWYQNQTPSIPKTTPILKCYSYMGRLDYVNQLEK